MYQIIDNLSGNDILKHEAITELNVIQCFNHLVYLAEKEMMK